MPGEEPSAGGAWQHNGARVGGRHSRQALGPSVLIRKRHFSSSRPIQDPQVSLIQGNREGHIQKGSDIPLEMIPSRRSTALNLWYAGGKGEKQEEGQCFSKEL